MTQQRINFFRLVALIIEVANLVISKYIQEKILGTDSFETFLNKEKHKMVHTFETSQCCDCGVQKVNRERLISKKQLSILYNSDKEKLNRTHIKRVQKKVKQTCICEYSAKEKIDVDVLDITLAAHIIRICGKDEQGIDNWIEQIKNVRNEIFHLSDINEMKNDKFTRRWTTLEGSIMGIAKTITDSTCAVETREKITKTKKIIVIYDYMLKFEKICLDDWKNKCAEFKRAQMQIIKEESALHYTIPQLFSRSMGKDDQKTMKQIGNLMVDKINVMINMFGNDETMKKFEAREAIKEDMQRIRIPVCMQLDIPTSWDKTKVFEALDEARLNGTPDMNIRFKAISIDDLNIFADISNKLLRNVDVFCSEINTMMSTMLSEAAIDTTADAQLCVNVEVQDMSCVPNADNIIEPQEGIGTPPDSSNQQCSTIEPVDNSDDVNISDTTEKNCELPDKIVYQQGSTTNSDDNSNAVNISETKEAMNERLDNYVIQQCSTTEPDGSSNAVNISETEEDIGDLPHNSVNQQCSTTEPDDNSNAVNISETKEEIDELSDISVNQQSSTTESDDNSNAVNIFETKEEIDELPGYSFNQQSSATESDGVSNANNIIEKEEEMGKPPDISTKQKCSTTEPEGLLNAESTIETKGEMETPTDSSNNHVFSTTKPDEITPTTACTEEAIVQTSLKNNLPVSANFRQKLKISKKYFWNRDPDIYSCIKIDNTLVSTDKENSRLIICNSDGTNKHHMSLSYQPYCITEIDSNTVAVSCGVNETILIINRSTRSVISTINTSSYCWGISYNDNNLYVIIDRRSIHVMDLTGKVIRTIPVPTDYINDITVDRDRLVCIDDTSIYCCSLEGQLMWKFKKDEIQDLRRVTIDDEGNVYATDYMKDIVVVVSDDGKHHRELLTESNGLKEPFGIYFDKKENILLVCNDCDAFLFDVKKQ